jgi:hypothetical protein
MGRVSHEQARLLKQLGKLKARRKGHLRMIRLNQTGAKRFV